MTERVLQRLQEQGNSTLEEAVARIVSETAERLVREEIQRIRNK